MKTQNRQSAKTSSYRAPELHQLGTLDKVQGWGWWVLDWGYGFFYY